MLLKRVITINPRESRLYFAKNNIQSSRYIIVNNSSGLILIYNILLGRNHGLENNTGNESSRLSKYTFKGRVNGLLTKNKIGIGLSWSLKYYNTESIYSINNYNISLLENKFKLNRK